MFSQQTKKKKKGKGGIMPMSQKKNRWGSDCPGVTVLP